MLLWGSLTFATQAVIVLLLGATATTWGLGLAVDLGAVAIAVLSVCTIGLAVSIRRPPPREPVLQEGATSAPCWRWPIDGIFEIL